MKLDAKQAKDLTDVLNAQSGVARIEDKAAYKTMVDSVGQFLNTKEGKATGGITKETYTDNKDNKELVAAAKAHMDKAKEREDKAKTKAETPSEAKPAAKGAMRTPEEEKETADLIVSYMNAKSGKGDKIAPDAYKHAVAKTKKYVDQVKGGLLNTAPEGKKSPWDRFKAFPGVKEACKAHQAFVKEQAKAEPAMG